MRDRIIAAGVRHLREFGYPGVTADNILADGVYRAFFRHQLEGTIEDAPGTEAAVQCRKLLDEMAVADCGPPKSKPKKGK